MSEQNPLKAESLVEKVQPKDSRIATEGDKPPVFYPETPHRVIDLSTVRRINIRNLVNLQERGQMNYMARKLGYSNSSFLSQMLGVNPSREVSENTARRIEFAYGLPTFSLDSLDFKPPSEEITVVSREDWEAVRKVAAVEIKAGQVAKAQPQPIAETQQTNALEVARKVVKLTLERCEAEGLQLSQEKFAGLLDLLLVDSFASRDVDTVRLETIVRLMR